MMTTDAVRSLPIEAWPAADRDGWRAACRPARLLDPGGRAAGMRGAAQQGHARSYGYLLDFLDRTGRLDPDAEPAGNVTPHNVDAYLAELDRRIVPNTGQPVGSVTRHAYVQRIHRVARILDPERDLGWLRDIVLLLAHQRRPRPKAHRIRRADTVRRAGIRLMQEAEASTEGTLLQRACLYRDGIMIALLFSCPIRLGTFFDLCLGTTIKSVDEGWWIDLDDDDTKSGRPDLRPVPTVLWPYLERWVTHWRPVFHPDSDALWPSIKGGGLAYTWVGTLISRITRRELGVDISPHLARDCAVYTVATTAGSEMGVASGLLQHTDPRVTQKHYNTGERFSAMQRYQALMDRWEGKTG